MCNEKHPTESERKAVLKIFCNLLNNFIFDVEDDLDNEILKEHLKALNTTLDSVKEEIK